ncbi:glucose-dependent insulinotropic receptor-like [Microcaecilia unicolor]|uniref:Glucose-dependent insulinotropic receptor-like n=1 Tax=Microcaecilia unicolor TaxID=1415580 RepID=A0A6P7Z4E3_9AMPH|nr:glucose-dependent insulinotropic receptor-like [Microcaecilia unicolor]
MSAIIYAVVHAVLSVLILTANILVIVIIIKIMKGRQGNSYIFILNLAAADLLVGIMCITELFDDLLDGDFDSSLILCLLRLCFTITPSIGSILTLILISLDRYLAVSLPLYYLKIMNKKSVAALIALLWIISFLIGHLPLILPALQESNYQGFCGLFYAARKEYLYVLCFSVFLPALVTLVSLHVSVGKIAYFHHRRIRRTSVPWAHHAFPFYHLKAARTALIVIICFTLAWGPYYVAGLVQVFCSSCNLLNLLKDILFILGETNSLLNPLIYTFYSQEIRRHLSQILRCKTKTAKPGLVSDVAVIHVRCSDPVLNQGET